MRKRAAGRPHRTSTTPVDSADEFRVEYGPDNGEPIDACRLIRDLEQERIKYAETGDPFALWWGYYIGRQLGLIPIWVLKGFDTIPPRLLQSALNRGLGKSKRKVHWTKDAAGVLGFRADAAGGHVDPFRRYVREMHPIKLAMRVRVLVDKDGHNETDACWLVARAQKVSEPTARRAWKRFNTTVRSASVEFTEQFLKDIDEP